MKRVICTKAAIRALRRMQKPASDRIRSKIAEYAADPASRANDIKATQGRTGIRLRVGDGRVILDDDGTVLDVLDIGPRGAIHD